MRTKKDIFFMRLFIKKIFHLRRRPKYPVKDHYLKGNGKRMGGRKCRYKESFTGQVGQSPF